MQKQSAFIRNIFLFVGSPLLIWPAIFVLEQVFSCRYSDNLAAANCIVLGLNISRIYPFVFLFGAWGLLITIPLGVVIGIIGALANRLNERSHS